MFYGHPIGAILAETRAIAKRASRAVSIEYQTSIPIITIEEAIEAGCLFDWQKHLEVGDVEEGFKEADHIVEGTVRVGAQEHFYMETHSCLVIPAGEDDEIEIYSATQDPNSVQVGIYTN